MEPEPVRSAGPSENALPTRKRLLRPGIRFEVPPLNIISFDPGGTSGITSLHYGGGWSDEITLDDLVVFGWSLGPEPHHDPLYQAMRLQAVNTYPLTIVSESFNYRQYAVESRQGERGNGAATVNLISCEYIGIMKLYAAQTGFEYREYSPADCKSFVSDEKLQAMGWFEYPATPKRHINDSKRPLINYLVRELGLHHPIVDSWKG